MKKYLLVFFCTFILFLSYSKIAISCSCGEPPPLKKEFNSTFAIFVGKVIKGEAIKIEDNYVDRKFTVEISKVIKGELKNIVEIFTSIDDADCGYDFIIGRSYLIYAWNNDKGNKLIINCCSRTKEQGKIEPEEKLLYYYNVDIEDDGLNEDNPKAPVKTGRVNRGRS